MNNVEKLQNELKQNQCALISSPFNRRYFTNFKSSAGTLIVTKNNAYFIVDFRYIEKAKATIKTAVPVLLENFKNQFNEIAEKEHINEIGIEEATMTVEEFDKIKSDYPNMEIFRISKIIDEYRKIKSENEIKIMEKAQAITDLAFEHMVKFIKAGMSEKEVSLELEYFMKKNGADALAFDNIVVSGKNSSLPHGVPTDKKIENGDFVTMDFGAFYDGYCSDMTRTVAVGFATDEMKEVYNTVLKAQEESLKAIKAGVIGTQIDKIARDIIYKEYKGCFGHGLGHSVGLEIHEMPCFNLSCKENIKENTVMTVEPGIYLENKFGVRIEDMILVTKDGYKNFTKSPKELIIL